MVILIAVGLYNIIARILLLKTVLIWRGVRVIDGAAGARSQGQGLYFSVSLLHKLFPLHFGGKGSDLFGV